MIAAQVLLDGLQAEDFGSSVESPGEHQCRRDVGLSGSRTKVRGSPPRERAANLRSRASGCKPVFVVFVRDVPSSTPVRWMDPPQQIG